MDKIEFLKYLNEFLNVDSISDYSLNGLVVDSEKDTISKIAIAVDASLYAIENAGKMGADILIAHHGFFWGKPISVDLWLRKRLKALFEYNMVLYVAHLPLDIHPDVGNNFGAMKLLGFDKVEPFGNYHGIKIGVKFEIPDELRDVDLLVKHVEKFLMPLKHVWRFGKGFHQYGVYCSGGCLSLLEQSSRAGINLFISGEASHAYYKIAEDMGSDVLLLGHYASETIGVKLLAEHLNSKFGLDYVFVDRESGL